MLAAFAFAAMAAMAQTSAAEFFADADGEKGAALKTALFQIIHPERQLRTYANLWTDFQLTDKREDGVIYDLAGRRISDSSVHGIYIKTGRKVLK